MNNKFYERCKRIVAKLSLTYEQGVAREVILNELDNLEKQAEDYQKRFNKAIELIKERQVAGYFKAIDFKDLLEILEGDSNE